MNWYTCGPTIYNRSHLGHARTFSLVDMMIRSFRALGHPIIHLMNITDIDDKILRRLGEDADEDAYHAFIEEHEAHFWEDMAALGNEPPQIVKRVSDSIPEIISYIETILENGFGYVSGGSVYLRTNRVKEAFGQEISKDDFTTQDETFLKEKEDKADFALWKASKEGEAIAFESPWGKGRPGWHIECSAMIHGIFKHNIHVHAGGVDLRFPHHANEHLQAMAYDGAKDPWNSVQWKHVGHLRVDEEKMSQSLGNFKTIRGFLDEGGDPMVLRIAFLMTPWHAPMEFGEGVMAEAGAHLTTIREFFSSVDHALKINPHHFRTPFGVSSKVFVTFVSTLNDRIQEALKDNFRNNVAFQIILEAIHKANVYLRSSDCLLSLVLSLASIVKKWLEVWGIRVETHTPQDLNTHLIDYVVGLREELRGMGRSKTFTKGDLFELTDRIRDVDLKEIGILLQDGSKGEPTKYRIEGK